HPGCHRPIDRPARPRSLSLGPCHRCLIRFTSVATTHLVNVTLAGKTAVITGAASGIGLAAVARFLEAGARGVVAVDVSEAPAALRDPADASRLRFVRGDVGVEQTASEFTRVALE